jgi:hypothetical protein
VSINAFIPEIWSAELLSSLKKSLIFGGPTVVNRDYEGDIRTQGDTVRITSISRPSVGTYVKGSTSIVPEQLTDAQRTLLIDQAKYFAFEVDDIDIAQAANGGALMTEAAVEAGYALADVADQFIAALYTGVDAANALGTIAVTSASPVDAYDKVLVPLKVALDQSNVPTAARWIVIPPWFHGRLLRDDRFIRWDASNTTEGLRNGIVGRAAGFDILVSNNAPFVTGDDYAVIAGHPMAISYAEQITETDAYEPHDSFSDALKGLHVYGAKLVRPTAIATAVASQT